MTTKSKSARKVAKSTKGAARNTARSAVYVAPKPALESIQDSLKIKWLGGANPRRAGSGPFEIYEVMRKARTVADFVGHEGCGKRWLAGAVARGLVKLAK
jgi:hypothetical protein